MISIFNERSRTLGGGSNERDLYVQFSVHLRDHLHYLKGAKLNVFMSLALHIDANGWSVDGSLNEDDCLTPKRCSRLYGNGSK
jgi:hypothetical protein